MWQCYDCGEEFEVPLIDYIGEFDVDERYCPNCGSDDINEL